MLYKGSLIVRACCPACMHGCRYIKLDNHFLSVTYPRRQRLTQHKRSEHNHTTPQQTFATIQQPSVISSLIQYGPFL